MTLATPEEIERAELLIQCAIYRKEHRREFTPEWYGWQREGFECPYRQVMTIAGNQTGKTWSGSYHFACDALGRYPDDWEGFVFDHATNTMAIGVDSIQLEILQTALFGKLESREFQGGWIHKNEIHVMNGRQSVEWMQGTTGIARKIVIKGQYGLATVYMRTYTQIKTGTKTLGFSGFSYDLIWCDEQPPEELVSQLGARLLNGNQGRGGRIRYTMTPELGETELITKFMDNPGKHQHFIGLVHWDDCAHMTPEAQEAALEMIPEFEHDLRRSGKPSWGSGMVWPIAEERIRCEPFQLPPYYRVLRAIDLGIDHPTAIGWLAFDPEEDVVYLVKDYAVKGEPAVIHASAANSMWPHSPCVFPHDADIREKGSGKTMRRIYAECGLKHGVDFKNRDGSIKVEPGIMEVYERMKTDRFKVFSICQNFWREFRMYHRKDGVIHKKNDDVMDVVRQGTVMIPRRGALVSGRIQKPKVKRAISQLFGG